jgi:hypothetical protein
MRGCGPFVHDDETDRPPAIFGAKVTLHVGPKRPARVLLPVIPSNERRARSKNVQVRSTQSRSRKIKTSTQRALTTPRKTTASTQRARRKRTTRK